VERAVVAPQHDKGEAEPAKQEAERENEDSDDCSKRAYVAPSGAGGTQAYQGHAERLSCHGEWIRRVDESPGYERDAAGYSRIRNVHHSPEEDVEQPFEDGATQGECGSNNEDVDHE
jgi:hypothetical protein